MKTISNGGFGFAVFWLCFILFMRDRLNLAIGLVIETARALSSMPLLIIFIPVFQGNESQGLKCTFARLSLGPFMSHPITGTVRHHPNMHSTNASHSTHHPTTPPTHRTALIALPPHHPAPPYDRSTVRRQ